MADVCITLPGGGDVKMKVGDYLCITIGDDCVWCYDDSDKCFSRHLMKGKKKKDPAHPRRYKAVALGRMWFHAPTSGDCTPCPPPTRGPKDTPAIPPHAVIVGPGG